MLVTPITKITPDGREISLTVGRIYEVLGIEVDDYRILTNEDALYWPNDPVLFEPECFRVVDASEPDFWISATGEDGERYAYPESWIRVGFFEDYHDHIQAVREQFWNDLSVLYPRTWAERQRRR
jgi:hypothetical protein